MEILGSWRLRVTVGWAHINFLESQITSQRLCTIWTVCMETRCPTKNSSGSVVINCLWWRTPMATIPWAWMSWMSFWICGTGALWLLLFLKLSVKKQNMSWYLGLAYMIHYFMDKTIKAPHTETDIIRLMTLQLLVPIFLLLTVPAIVFLSRTYDGILSRSPRMWAQNVTFCCSWNFIWCSRQTFRG